MMLRSRIPLIVVADVAALSVAAAIVWYVLLFG
jgi:hypothetical protein